MKNCASCNAIGKDLTGPDLAWVEERWKSKSNLIEYIKNNRNFMDYHETHDTISDYAKHYDGEYARLLFCQWNKQAMTLFDGVLTEKEVEAILDFVKSESFVCKKPIRVYDSCKVLKAKIDNLVYEKDKIEENKNDLIIADYKPQVLPTLRKPQYYNIEVEKFGWFNIDVIVNDDPNNIYVNYSVNETSEVIANTDFYIVIPSLKIFSNIEVNENTKLLSQYGNKFKLPKETEAYLFAIHQNKEIIKYSLESFITKEQLTLKTNFIQIDSKELSKLISKTLNTDSVKLNIKPVETIFKRIGIEKNIKKLEEELKQKKCECLDSRIFYGYVDGGYGNRIPAPAAGEYLELPVESEPIFTENKKP